MVTVHHPPNNGPGKSVEYSVLDNDRGETAHKSLDRLQWVGLTHNLQVSSP